MNDLKLEPEHFRCIDNDYHVTYRVEDLSNDPSATDAPENGLRVVRAEITTGDERMNVESPRFRPTVAQQRKMALETTAEIIDFTIRCHATPYIKDQFINEYNICKPNPDWNLVNDHPPIHKIPKPPTMK